LLGVIDIDHKGAVPVAVVVVFVEQGGVGTFTPGYALEALFGAGDLGGRCGEGGFLQHHLVACGNLHLPVATVKRLGPHQGGWIIGAPVEFARAERLAMDRHAVCQGQCGNGVDLDLVAVGGVPDIHVARESLVCGHVRVGFVDGRDQQMAAIGCGIDGLDVGGFAKSGDPGAGAIDQGHLRHGVVVEQVLLFSVSRVS